MTHGAGKVAVADCVMVPSLTVIVDDVKIVPLGHHCSVVQIAPGMIVPVSADEPGSAEAEINVPSPPVTIVTVTVSFVVPLFVTCQTTIG